MKFAMMSLDFRRIPLEQCFKLVRDYGFDGMELWGSRLHAHPDDIKPADAQRILNWKKEYGIEIPMYSPSVLGFPYCLCSRVAEERNDGVAFYKKMVDVANMLEIPRILLIADHPGYFISRAEAWGFLVESVKEITAYAGDKGVRTVIEPLTPMESPIITTAEDCVRLIRDVEIPNLYAMLDVVPPVIVHEPYSHYFVFLGEKLDYIHLCNTDGQTDAHLRLDKGILPITDVINVFKHWNYQGYVTIEMYSESYRDPELLLSNTARIIHNIKQELSL